MVQASLRFSLKHCILYFFILSALTSVTRKSLCVAVPSSQETGPEANLEVQGSKPSPQVLSSDKFLTKNASLGAESQPESVAKEEKEHHHKHERPRKKS